MSSNSEPASTSYDNNDSEDSVQLSKSASSSDIPPNPNQNSSYSEGASSDSYYSIKQSKKYKSNQSANRSKSNQNSSSAEIKLKKQTYSAKSTKSDSSNRHPKNKQGNISTSQSKENYYSDSYYTRSNSGSFTDNNNNQNSEAGEAPLTSLAKIKTGPLKIKRPKKKKHYQFEMIDEVEQFESTDDEPQNMERNVNTRSQLKNDAGLDPTQAKSKCCILI